MAYIATGLLLQHIFSSLSDAGWLVPDFVLIGLILAIARSPERWIAYAALIAGCLLLWALRMPLVLASAWFLSAAAIHWAAKRWNVNEPRVLLSICAALCFFIHGLLVWSEDLWSWLILALLLSRIFLTLVCLMAVYPVWRSSREAL